MPSTRRTSGPRSTNAPGGKQATLSFHNRVTKSSTGSKSAKNNLTTPTKPSPLAKRVISAQLESADEEVDEQEPEDIEVDEEPERVKSDAEVRAAKIHDRQIEKYWREVEKERKSKRVHQEDLGTGEKVLRYFDVSSHYGPCVGIDRMKRWQRAERLGLNPPVEVLAVLLKEEKRGTKSFETAHMDHILNSTSVGAV